MVKEEIPMGGAKKEGNLANDDEKRQGPQVGKKKSGLK